MMSSRSLPNVICRSNQPWIRWLGDCQGLLPAVMGKQLQEAIDTRADTVPCRFPTGYGHHSAHRRTDALVALATDARSEGEGDGSSCGDRGCGRCRGGTQKRRDRCHCAGWSPYRTPESRSRPLRRCDRGHRSSPQTATPLTIGRRSRTIPPRLRRYILGPRRRLCRRRMRIPVPLTGPPSGPLHRGRIELTRTTSPALCWYHHHIVIHGHGFAINPNTPTQAASASTHPSGHDHHPNGPSLHEERESQSASCVLRRSRRLRGGLCLLSGASR